MQSQIRLATLRFSNKQTRRPQTTASGAIRRKARLTQLERHRLVGSRRGRSLEELVQVGTSRAPSPQSLIIVEAALVVPSPIRDRTTPLATIGQSTNKLMRWRKVEVGKSASSSRKSNRHLNRVQARASKLILHARQIITRKVQK